MNLNTQFTLFKTVSHQERLIFTKHLSTMLKSGIPIGEALDALIEQTKSNYFKKALTAILDDVKNGKSLAPSFRKYPKIFDNFYTSLIEVGEASGTLEKNLEFLALQLAKDYSLRKKVQGAMVYPAIVLGATFLLGGFLSIYILPKLVDFFKSFDIELPLTTKILIFVAEIMRDFGIVIIVGFIVLIVLFKFVVATRIVKPLWHAILLKVPIMGPLLTYSQLARFARNLGTLVKSGVPILKSLEITADTLSNLSFSTSLVELAKSLSKGKNIGETLRSKKYSQFPPLVSRMISVGEKTGKLDENLLYLSDFFDDEVDDISKNLATTLEPALLIFVGAIVGFVALSIISPIYQLTGSIRR